MTSAQGKWLKHEVREQWIIALRWWRKQDDRHGWRWRVANEVILGVLVASILMPVLSHLHQIGEYKLSADTVKLVGTTNAKLAKQLTYDKTTDTYEFNKAAVKTDDSLSTLTSLQSQTGTASGGKDASLYALDLPADLSQGVTYHDINSELSFRLVPQFTASEGKLAQGHLVYPMDDGSQAIYTLKGNGLKEDIVVPHVSANTMSFTYELNLPDTLAAKMIPDGGGAIGIYSADPALFGNITYGSSADEASVQKARTTSVKTNLVFSLPAPVVKTTSGKTVGSARFELNGDTLTVVADDLSGIKTPITIDPSVVVTAVTDFAVGGSNDGDITYDATNNQITRSAVAGGTVQTGGWTTSTALPIGRFGQATVAANGFIYMLGGCSAGSCTTYKNDVLFAPLTAATGAIGAWHYTHNSTDDSTTFVAGFTTARFGMSAVVYGGYVYLMGGYSGADQNDVQYAALNTNGTVGTWNTANSFTTARWGASAAAYGGYVYLMGGCTVGQTCSTSVLNDVQYAPITGSGALGAWHYTHNSGDDGTSFSAGFTNGRLGLSATAYNGYLYIMAGCPVGTTTEGCSSTYYSDVQYAQINSNGTVGAWNTTTSFTTGRLFAAATVSNGYMYIMGGNSGSLDNDTQYAQINANGSLGNWTATTSFTTTRWGLSTASYNGVIYMIGGCSTTGTCSAFQTTTAYAKLDAGGMPNTPATSTVLSGTHTSLVCTTVYNGKIFAIGGSTDDSTGNGTQVYDAPISSTGIGTWTPGTSLPASRAEPGCIAFNGFMYVVGGFSSTSTVLNTVLYLSVTSLIAATGTWTNPGTGNLTAATEKPGVFMYTNSNGTYLYSIGGFSSTVVANIINYATVNANGTLSAWAAGNNTGYTNNQARGYGQVGKYIYAFGGKGVTTGTITATVDYTTVNANGTLANWTTTGALNTAVGYGGSTTINGCIYSIGGESTVGTSLNNVQYACPTSSGTISAWTNAPNLPTATTDFSGASSGTTLFTVGGFTTAVVTTTYYANVNNGGTGGTGASWTTSAHAFTTGRYVTKSVAYNGYLYMIAGDDGAGHALGDIQYAPITSAGDIGTFATDSGHPFNTTALREDMSVVANNGYLYIIGGTNPGGTIEYGDVQYAPIGSSGALSGGFINTTTLAANRSGACSLVSNGYMYVIGGWDGTTDHADTVFAPVNSDGSLGAWTDSGNNFTSGRSEEGCFASNGYIYIAGGNGAANYSDVQSAAINSSNGTLGTWVYTASFNGVRENPVFAVANGFAYISGGCDVNPCTSSSLGDTQYAPITANGTLGSWQYATAVSSSHGEATGFIYNGYLYEQVGSATNINANIQYAALNSMSRTGRYSKMIDLGATSVVDSITYNGTIPSAATNVTYKTAGADGVFGAGGSSAAGIPLVADISCTTTAVYGVRYLLVTFVLDDSSGLAGSDALFPDAGGTAANVTDFTVNYNAGSHPAANIRLRGGQTIQTGTSSPLDTCVLTYPPPVVASVGSAGGQHSNGSTIAVGVPSGVAANSLVVAYAWGNYSTASTPAATVITPPTGAGTWSLGGSITLNDGTNEGYVGDWFYKRATAADTGTYTFTFSNVSGGPPTFSYGYAARITGAPSSGNPFVDTFHSNSAVAPNSQVNVATFTPGGDYSLFLGGYGVASGQVTLTAPSGWTTNAQFSSNQDYGIGVMSATQNAAAATGTLAFKASSFGTMFALVGTIRGGP